MIQAEEVRIGGVQAVGTRRHEEVEMVFGIWMGRSLTLTHHSLSLTHAAHSASHASLSDPPASFYDSHASDSHTSLSDSERCAAGRRDSKA